MRVRNTRDLGSLLRHSRRDRGLSQEELAHRIGASRHWVIGVERGKPTAEIGLVLKAMSALGLVCDIRKSGPAGILDSAGRGASVHTEAGRAPDLGVVLRRSRGGRITPPSHARRETEAAAAERRGPEVPVPDLGEVLRRMTGKPFTPGRSGKAGRKRSRSKDR